MVDEEVVEVDVDVSYNLCQLLPVVSYFALLLFARVVVLLNLLSMIAMLCC